MPKKPKMFWVETTPVTPIAPKERRKLDKLGSALLIATLLNAKVIDLTFARSHAYCYGNKQYDPNMTPLEAAISPELNYIPEELFWFDDA